MRKNYNQAMDTEAPRRFKNLTGYTLTKTEDGFCPDCKHNVFFLMPIKLIPGLSLPCFIICFNCTRTCMTGVGQVGGYRKRLTKKKK